MLDIQNKLVSSTMVFPFSIIIYFQKSKNASNNISYYILGVLLKW